jgi:hypothetical protein
LIEEPFAVNFLQETFKLAYFIHRFPGRGSSNQPSGQGNFSDLPFGEDDVKVMEGQVESGKMGPGAACESGYLLPSITS